MIGDLNATQEFKDIANNSIAAFKSFEVVQSMEDEGQNERILEATLALIGCKLLGEEEKRAIQTIFSIMDDSGDGKL